MKLVIIFFIGTLAVTSCHAWLGWGGDDTVPEYDESQDQLQQASQAHHQHGSSSSHSHHHESSGHRGHGDGERLENGSTASTGEEGKENSNDVHLTTESSSSTASPSSSKGCSHGRKRGSASQKHSLHSSSVVSAPEKGEEEQEKIEKSVTENEEVEDSEQEEEEDDDDSSEEDDSDDEESEEGDSHPPQHQQKDSKHSSHQNDHTEHHVKKEVHIPRFSQDQDHWYNSEESSSHLHQPCPMLYTRIGHRCVAIFSIAQASWQDASNFCRSIYGELISFRGIQEYLYFLDHLQISGASADLWIGGKMNDKTWQWIDGSSMPLGSPYWAIRETHYPTWSKSDVYSQAPNPTLSIGHGTYEAKCTALSPKYFYYMSDENCSDKRSPVCVLRDGVEVMVLKDWADGGNIPVEVSTVMPQPLTPGTATPTGTPEVIPTPREGSGADESEGSGSNMWLDDLSFDSE